MEPVEPSQSTEYVDQLTGLMTVPGWIAELPEGAIAGSGGLIAIDIAGLGGVNQAFGHGAGDALLEEVVRRAHKALPAESALVCGTGTTLFAWIPSITKVVIQAFVSHLHQGISSSPASLPGGEQVYPKLIMACIFVGENTRAQDAIRTVQRELVQQPEFSATPVALTRAVSALDELDHRMEAMRLFGHDTFIERVLAQLKLPSVQPQSVIVMGPPQVGKKRLLDGVAALLCGQNIPLAQITCRSAEQGIAFYLVTGLIQRFLTASPSPVLQERLGGTLTVYPWLGRLFPALLGGGGNGPLPPEEPFLVRRGLESVLVELARSVPHVGMVHSIHLADEQSLALLSDVQKMSGHGLRIVASAPARGEEVPASLRDLAAENCAIMRIAPLTREELLAYLKEVAPAVAHPSVAALLHEATEGLPLAVEATLRAWVAEGSLSFHLGDWAFFPEEGAVRAGAGLNALDRELLGKAALAGPTSISMLADLWHTTEEDARATVARARCQGLLAAEDPGAPDYVRFHDLDQASSAASRLTPEEREAVLRQIIALREAGRERAGGRAAWTLGAPTAGVGPPSVPSPAPTPPGVLVAPEEVEEGWHILPPAPIERDDIPYLVDAVIALRLAGAQLRLYAPDSEQARQPLLDAKATLDRLLDRHPTMVIEFARDAATFNGYALQRSDIEYAVHDLCVWAAKGNVRSVRMSRGVTEDELSGFLHLFAAYERGWQSASMASQVKSLGLEHITVRFTAEREEDEAKSGAPAAPAAGLEAGAEILAPIDYGLAEVLAAPDELDEQTASKVLSLLLKASVPTRQLAVSNLARWLLTRDKGSTIHVPEHVDRLLSDLVQLEEKPRAMREVGRAAEIRLTQFMARGEWPRLLKLLETVIRRRDKGTSEEIEATLAAVVDHLGGRVIDHGLVEWALERPDGMSVARRVINLLGERALRPLISALKNAPDVGARVQLMQFLREVSDSQQRLLQEELRQPNPWYVYRNLLQVLAETGTEEALGAISEKIGFDDPRVRAEAVVAAVQIAREKGGVYLAQGLDDVDPEVRARAASVAWLCPQQTVLNLLLRMLRSVQPSREQPASVQMSACFALGHFAGLDAARDALILIVRPGLFSPYGKKNDEVRGAAVMAVGNYMGQSRVRDVIQHATRDRSLAVRQAAQRLLQEYHPRASDSAPRDA